jgi:hypothetical protein
VLLLEDWSRGDKERPRPRIPAIAGVDYTFVYVFDRARDASHMATNAMCYFQAGDQSSFFLFTREREAMYPSVHVTWAEPGKYTVGGIMDAGADGRDMAGAMLDVDVRGADEPVFSH